MTWHLVMAKEKGHLQTPSCFFAVAANGLDPPISFNSTSLQSEEFLGLKIWRKRCNKFAVIFIFAVLTTKTFAPKSSTQNFPPTNFQIKLPTSIMTSSHGFLGLFTQHFTFWTRLVLCWLYSFLCFVLIALCWEEKHRPINLVRGVSPIRVSTRRQSMNRMGTSSGQPLEVHMYRTSGRSGTFRDCGRYSLSIRLTHQNVPWYLC